MPNIKKLIFPYSQTGLTTVCIVMKQVATGYFLDHVDGVYRATPANSHVPLTELAIPEQGTYERDENRSIWPDGEYIGTVYPDATDTKASIGSEEMYVIDDTEVIVDKYLDDIYAKPLVTLPAMQARVYSAFLIQNQITKIKQGDTPRINFQIEGDWSTWTARFGVKGVVTDTAYKIGPKDCVIGAYDPVTGTTAGYVDLTTTDTATAGTKWLGEIEFKKAGSVQTLINYLLTIETDVIK